MKILELKNKNLDYKQFIKRAAAESDYETLITEPTIGVENGEIKFVYDFIPDGIDTGNFVDALKTIKYHEGKRARGLVSRSRIFGYRPRLEMRADFCSSTSLASEFPKEHAIVCDFARVIEEIYSSRHPDGYKKHKEDVAGVKPEWKIGKGIFTSGIINKNNPLKYHFDTGNFTKVYSCMPVFKSGIKGGHLALPEYGIGIELKDRSIFMFDGQGIMHGVTPIKYESPLSYRYSVVYYSLKRIWQCLEIDEELARIRQKKTKREKERLNMPAEKLASLKKRYGKQ